jgi:hypothetical protein
LLPDQIIEPNTLRTDDGRVSVSVRIPWYRALPLSSISQVSLDIDGQQVPTESIVWLTAHGERYALDELPPRHDKWWFVLDSAVLEGELPPLAEADEHEVHVVIGLYIPYVPAADGAPLVLEQDRKTMKLERAV